MKKKIQSFLQVEFVRNVATLTLGTILAQAIPIGISPILTRLYSPEDFGILALFTSMTAIFGAISTAKYEMAIMLPKEEKEALNILYLSVIIATAFSLFLFVVVFFCGNSIVDILEEPQIKPWLYFVPLSVLFLGIFNALNLYNTRKKNFKTIAISQIYKSSGMGATQVGLGLLKMGGFGLILGQIVSFVSGNFILYENLVREHSIKETFDKKLVREMAKRYNRFPKLSLPGNLMNVLTLNVINFLISAIYSTGILGFYSLAKRMLGMPSILLGKNISQVYFQKMSATKNSDEDLETVFLSTFKKLLLVSLPVFFIAFFIVEPIFAFVFGEEWRVAGTYAKIIIPLAGFRFISSALSPTINIFEKQQYSIIINGVLLLTTLVCFFYGKQNQIPFEKLLSFYVIILSVEYLAFIMAYWKIVKNYNLVTRR